MNNYCNIKDCVEYDKTSCSEKQENEDLKYEQTIKQNKAALKAETFKN